MTRSPAHLSRIRRRAVRGTAMLLCIATSACGETERPGEGTPPPADTGASAQREFLDNLAAQ